MVGGWWRLAVGGSWRLVAVGGWWLLGAVLKGCPEQKKIVRTALEHHQGKAQQHRDYCTAARCGGMRWLRFY